MNKAVYRYLHLCYIFVYTRHSIDNHWFFTNNVKFSRFREDVEVYAIYIYVIFLNTQDIL